MTDQELLELAAKAAGISSTLKFPYVSKDGLATGWTDWNPITNDGDAFRLAVKLGMMVYVNTKNKEVDVCADSKSVFRFDFDQEPYAATRRAIVKAAAEIGKDMK